MARAAMVTLLFGDRYLSYWRTHCEATWRAYAQKHQLDLIIQTALPDGSPRGLARSPAWQKCLILGQDFSSRYEQIIWLDSDIVINPATAPSILDQVPPERVGGVISGSHIHADLRVVMLERLRGLSLQYQKGSSYWQQSQDAYYIECGLSPQEAGIIQTGVLVASPKHHRQLFESVYHEPRSLETRAYEQVPLSHAILSNNLFQPVDSRFNHVFFETMAVYYPYLLEQSFTNQEQLARYALRTQFATNFFLHFAYDAQRVRFLFD